MPWLFGRKKSTEEGVKRTRDAWFGRVVRLFHTRGLGEETWEELEETLVSADVGMRTTQAILGRVRELVKAREGKATAEDAVQALREEMTAALGEVSEGVAGLLEGKEARPKPLVVLVVGVNGSGKTTSIAKLARYFQEQGGQVLLGAGDTFRAAAIDQLQVWGQRLGAEVVAHQQGGDPAAVAFDALQAGVARSADVVIIDTAGRLHSKQNLMDELRKVRRVLSRLDPSAPHLTLLVLDATTGQNGLAQARAFTEAVACDGVVLAKLDGTAKGGVVFSIRQELGVPVLFIGTGEKAEDLSPFNPQQFVEALLSPTGVETAA
ncbi:MAG: signal recognition particle-docking protein FtsY [Chloroflexi bacterium]|nr:signal recognition particle-docking protein FtsY [Chloroflexota bacterium]